MEGCLLWRVTVEVTVEVEDHRSGGQFTMKGHLLWRIRRVIAMKGHCYKSICREGHLL